MSVLFTGYYGNENTGDDAFCLISDWGASTYWDTKKSKFFGRKLPLRQNGTQLRSSVLHKEYFKKQKDIELYSQGLLSKNIIYSGGSIFHSDIKGWFNKSNVFYKYKKAGLVNLGAIGVSLGPYKSSTARESIKEYLKYFSFLSLRDQTSYEEALSMDLSIPIIKSFDMAALLPLMYPIKKNENSDITIGISFCDYQLHLPNGSVYKDQERFRKTVETLNILITKINFKVKILVFNGHPIYGDQRRSLELQNSLDPKIKSEVVPYNPNTYVMWETIGNCSLVLATRLHAGIFSCFSSTPFIQVEYHKKCGDFLDEISYNNKFRIGDFEKEPSEVVQIILQILQKEVYQNTPNKLIQQKAERNFTLTKQYL